jgi:predicted DCC family thiol-disulfide oxidoreductase YuxK
MNLGLLNALCYIIGWMWAVLFGINGHTLISLIGVILLIALQLMYTKHKSLKLYIQDLGILTFTLSFGIILEVFLNLTDIVSYTGNKGIFPPVWILGLYPLFSLLINHISFKKTEGLTFICGFFAAVLSYYSIKALGGLDFGYPMGISLLIIGVILGLFLILLKKIADIIAEAAIKTFKDKSSSEKWKFFYDGDCPICNREACAIEKRSINEQMEFININSREFIIQSGNLDYETAMKKMHAIDDNGNTITALDAFAVAYARSNRLFLATLLNISFLRPMLDKFYNTFAKHRMFLTGRKKILK